MASVMSTPWLRLALRRRIIFAVAALLLGVLSIWPQHYAAEAQLEPQDSGGGLSAALAGQGAAGGLLSLGALLGNKQPIEADLTIARSHAVLDLVIRDLRLVGRPGFGNLNGAEVALRQKLGVIAIRGNILQITARDRNPALALGIVAATADAIQTRLADISLKQAAQKRAVARDRLSDATISLARAQAALSQFRTVNRLAAPEQQLGAAVGLLASLEGRLQAKQVEVATLENFETADNIRLKAAHDELAAIRAQVEAAKVASRGQDTSNLAGIASTNEVYFNLYRDEKAAEILYEVYRRYLEEVAVDELSANENLILVEPAYIYPERQYNIGAVGLLSVVILLWICTEFYLVKPPIGRR